VYAQTKKNDVLIEKKLDTIILMLKQNKFDSVMTAVNKINKAEIDQIKKNYELEQLKLDSIRLKFNQELQILQKQKSEIQAKLESNNVEFKTQLTGILQQTMKSGTSLGMATVENFLALAKANKTTNEKDYIEFSNLFKEVINIEHEFDTLSVFEKTINKAYELYAKTNNYPGLGKDISHLLFKLNNYCEYEKKLMDLIALSRTQVSEENRIKQLNRQKSDFKDYPALKDQIEKVKSNKEYSITPKCSQ
jgi:hypothetical protein